MKINFLLLLVFIAIRANGQDTTYYDADWKVTDSQKHSEFMEVLQHDPADTNRATETVYYRSGKMRSQRTYSDYTGRKLDGKLMEWYSSGQVRKEIDYTDDKINGRLLTYWENGKPKRIDVYENGKFIEGRCMNSDGKETMHYDYEIMPEFPGGINQLMQYLIKETKYPARARRKGIEGRVVVGFVVGKNGTLSDVKVIKPVNAELDEEAIRVVKEMPRWEPGMQDGEAVRVTFNLPILFKLR